MLKVGDTVRCAPSILAKSSPTTATVTYIHPKGRFYVVRFDCPKGSFQESREFTHQELEEAYQRGIFQRPKVEVLYDPREKRREEQAQKWRENHRPVEEPDYVDDNEDDISTIMAMA